MKKWSILLLLVVASMAFQSCGGKEPKRSGAGGSSSAMAEAEQADFMEYMKQRANSGELFRSIKESFEETCEIFEDYVGGDDVYMTMSLSGIREQMSLPDFSGNVGYDVY
jgi:hypothetical protein